MDDRPEGADVIEEMLGIIGGMVGDRPNCMALVPSSGTLKRVLTSDLSSSASVAEVAASMRSSHRLPWAQAAVCGSADRAFLSPRLGRLP